MEFDEHFGKILRTKAPFFRENQKSTRGGEFGHSAVRLVDVVLTLLSGVFGVFGKYFTN